jgi:chemotaxis-related protein WspB
VVQFDRSAGDARRPARLGLVAEDVISIRSAEDADAAFPPLNLPDAPFLGRILRLGGHTVQLIEVAKLLPDDLANGLCATAPEAQVP